VVETVVTIVLGGEELHHVGTGHVAGEVIEHPPKVLRGRETTRGGFQVSEDGLKWGGRRTEINLP